MKLRLRTFIVPLLLALTPMGLSQCGGLERIETQDTMAPDGELNANEAANEQGGVANPFLGALENGDRFDWGRFIRAPYQSTTIRDLPIPIYLAFFSDDEEAVVAEGIELANQAIGYELFAITDRWDAEVRVIYKVTDIAFEGEYAADTQDHIIGYTYSRNIYLDSKYDAGRVVTDWAIELKAGYITPWVVAHELGHAMGIQQHALIDYRNDTTVPLEPNSLMAAVITDDPVLGDYSFMMGEQADLLLEYLEY